MSTTSKKEKFGQMPTGEDVWLFTLQNEHGMIACVTNYGAILTQLHVPDAQGKSENIVMGFDNLEQYLRKHPHFGGTIGRFANRIAGANFDLDGKNYKLIANNGPNCLHGGPLGFDKKLWHVENSSDNAVHLSYVSVDGEEGFPGNLKVYLTYELTSNNALSTKYEARTDKATPVNFTNHTYFNLKGPGSGDILDHELMIAADSYTPFDDVSIPTGAIESVKSTPFDFIESHPIRDKISEMKIGGYDHNYVLRHFDPVDTRSPDAIPKLAAVLYERTTGRRMAVRTTEPGVQLYTSNNLDGSLTGLGGQYKKQYAVCLETQHFPDSVHHSNFPSTILRPQETYYQTTVFDFGSAD